MIFQHYSDTSLLFLLSALAERASHDGGMVRLDTFTKGVPVAYGTQI